MKKESLLISAVFLFIVLNYPFISNVAYRGLDGSYYINLSKELGTGGCPYIGLGISHLQGASSLQFPTNFKSSFSFSFARILPWSEQASLFISSSFIICLGSLFLARVLEIKEVNSAGFCLLNCIALLPIPCGFYNLAGNSPAFPEISILSCLAVGLSLKQNKRSYLRNLCFAGTIFVYLLLSYPPIAILILPLIGTWVYLSANTIIKNKNNLKNFFFLILILIVFLILFWISGHLSNSAFALSKNKIIEKISLSDITLNFWTPRSNFAVGILFIGLVSSILLILRKSLCNSIAFKIAFFVLGLVVLQIIFLVCLLFGFHPKRPFGLVYLEYIFYPFYFASIYAGIACSANNLTGKINPFLLKIYQNSFIILSLFGCAQLVLLAFEHNNKKTEKDFFAEPQKNKIIKLIESSISLNKASNDFAGRSESFLALGEPKAASYDWLEFHAFQGICTDVFQNDLRTTGLWNFGIPTLFHYSPLRDPFLHQFTKQFLARPPDSVWKNVPVYTNINPNALGLLGVRFVITDSKITEQKVELKAFIPWPKEKEKLKSQWWLYPDRENPWLGIQGIYLYELNKVNLGTQSPVLVFSEKNDADTVLKTLMGEGYFRGERPIAVHSKQNLIAPEKAKNVKILYSPTGFKISAKSKGLSCLLLPFTFSNCLKYFPDVKSSKEESVKLFRANLAQTLLIFDKDISGEIKYISSPFYNPQDIWKDVLNGKHALNK